MIRLFHLIDAAPEGIPTLRDWKKQEYNAFGNKTGEVVAQGERYCLLLSSIKRYHMLCMPIQHSDLLKYSSH